MIKRKDDCRKIIIFGNGPSILLENVPELMKYVTIGTNRILREPLKKWAAISGWCIRPDIVLIVDLNVLRQEYARLLNYKPNLVLYNQKKMKNESKDLVTQMSVDYIDLDGKKGYDDMDLGWDKTFNQNHLNSGFYALELAYRLLQGRGTVGLLGMEFRYPGGYPTHFYGDGRKEGTTPHMFGASIDWLKKIKHQITRGSFEVYNLSRITGPLDGIIPRVTVEEFHTLPDVPKCT